MSRRRTCSKSIDGLETNRINQLVVLPTLQTTRDEDIFAIGDCAACPWPGHDQARVRRAHRPRTSRPRIWSGSCQRRLARASHSTEWRYRDFGSLVSLGRIFHGRQPDGQAHGRQPVHRGLFARLMYRSLYKMHELALHGPTKVTLDTAARLITRRTEPHVKLH